MIVAFIAVAIIGGTKAPSASTNERSRPVGRARHDERKILVSPELLTFDTNRAQAVKVTVNGPTIVYAHSSNPRAASVSLDPVRVPGSAGRLRFMITPHAGHQRAAQICFVTSDWRYDCVLALVGNGRPHPAAPVPTLTPFAVENAATPPAPPTMAATSTPAVSPDTPPPLPSPSLKSSAPSLLLISSPTPGND